MANSSSPWVRNVTADTFQADVVEPSREHPVLVDFWSPQCQPCLMLAPLLEKLIDERQGKVLLAKVNVEEEQELASYFGISAVPSVKVIFNGQLVHEFEGLLPEPALRQFLDQISPASDPAMQRAQAAELSAPARAEQEYRRILAEQPDNEQARLGLARSLLAQDRLDEIDQVLEPLGVEGETGVEVDRIKAQIHLMGAARDLRDEAALRSQVAQEPKNAVARLELGTVLARKGDYKEALEVLLSAAELDMKLAEGKVREIMVKVFQALGSNHPLSNEYRSRLSRLLY